MSRLSSPPVFALFEYAAKGIAMGLSLAAPSQY
jgi:hypothetical protein